MNLTPSHLPCFKTTISLHLTGNASLVGRDGGSLPFHPTDERDMVKLRDLGPVSCSTFKVIMISWSYFKVTCIKALENSIQELLPSIHQKYNFILIWQFKVPKHFQVLLPRTKYFTGAFWNGRKNRWSYYFKHDKLKSYIVFTLILPSPVMKF